MRKFHANRVKFTQEGRGKHLCHYLDTFCQFMYSGGSRTDLSFLTRRQLSQ